MHAIPLKLTQEIDESTRVLKPTDKEEKIEKYKYSLCYNCLNEVEQSNFYDISYKLLLEGHSESLKSTVPPNPDESFTKLQNKKHILMANKLIDEGGGRNIVRHKKEKSKDNDMNNIPFVIKYFNPEVREFSCAELLDIPEL